MSESSQPQFWLEKIVNEISSQKPEGELIVSSGASPSGSYHVGHLREFLTADAIAWGLRRAGRDATHIHFVDDSDRFRKVPANVDASFEQYFDIPLYLVPSPDGEGSYGDFFFRPIKTALDAMGADMQVVHSYQKYGEGYFGDTILQVLENLDDVKAIIEEVSGRQLSKRWAPVQILDENNSYATRWFTGFDAEKRVVTFDSDDGSGEISVDSGKVKLDWRIDWPARWALLPVAVEPFGRDHATKGGSYDTGKEVVERVLGAPAPIPVPYEFINVKGQTKKMSASSGDGITPEQALKIMPPAVLKDFVLGVRPNLQLFLDIGPGFGQMFDEFAQREREADYSMPISRMALAKNGDSEAILPSIPFNHMVVAWQSAQKDADAAIEILKRSEHAEEVEDQSDLIKSVFPYIEAWLQDWAPETLKFEVQQTAPQVELEDAQRQLLTRLADAIESSSGDKDGEWYHKTVHEIRESLELTPKQAFVALYRALLDKDSGPKAGWFLSTFEADWLIERFRSVDS